MRDLALDHVDDRGVPEARVRPEEEEEVREAGHRRSQVRLGAAVPRFVERPAAAPSHVLAEGEIGHVKAGAEDDRVDRALLAVAGHDRAGADLLDAVGDDVDVALGERCGGTWLEKRMRLQPSV